MLHAAGLLGEWMGAVFGSATCSRKHSEGAPSNLKAFPTSRCRNTFLWNTICGMFVATGLLLNIIWNGFFLGGLLPGKSPKKKTCRLREFQRFLSAERPGSIVEPVIYLSLAAMNLRIDASFVHTISIHFISARLKYVERFTFDVCKLRPGVRQGHVTCPAREIAISLLTDSAHQGHVACQARLNAVAEFVNVKRAGEEPVPTTFANIDIKGTPAKGCIYARPCRTPAMTVKTRTVSMYGGTTTPDAFGKGRNHA